MALERMKCPHTVQASEFVSECYKMHHSPAIRSFKSGVEAYQRYWPLINEQSLPFIRSDVSQRDVDSASNWTAGMTDSTPLLFFSVDHTAIIGFSAASHHNLNPSISYVTDVAAVCFVLSRLPGLLTSTGRETIR